MSRFFAFVLTVLALPALAQRQPDPAQKITRIAFGSCAHENKKQPVLQSVVRADPDLFVYLGDNIYGDTRDMEILRDKYATLGAKKEFQALCKAVPVLATWDDHDYGENDAGRDYPFRTESRDIFLDFWKEPANSPRRKHSGIYHSMILGPADCRVQVILLDTRTFRDHLLPNNGKPWINDYRPNESRDSTFLGIEQWEWLEEQLLQPADLRIIASSNQFAHSYNGWESWTNVPREQEKMLDLIRDTRAGGVVFISGDVHWGELSRMESPENYPIYDLTSSGITQEWHRIESNAHRVGAPMAGNNFGMIEIDWEKRELTFELRDKRGARVLEHRVTLADLQD